MASSSRPKPVPRSGKSVSGARSPESFQSLNERNNAAEILQSYEKLSWLSMQRCEVWESSFITGTSANYHQSLTQTRLHFQNIVAGFTRDDEAALIDWKEDLSPRGEVTKTEKGKERVSDVGVGVSGGGSASAASSAKKKRKSDGRVAP